MTSFVSGGTLNSTHSLTTALFMSMTMIPVSSALEHSVRKWGELTINTWDAPNSTQSKKHSTSHLSTLTVHATDVAVHGDLLLKATISPSCEETEVW